MSLVDRGNSSSNPPCSITVMLARQSHCTGGEAHPCLRSQDRQAGCTRIGCPHGFSSSSKRSPVHCRLESWGWDRCQQQRTGQCLRPAPWAWVNRAHAPCWRGTSAERTTLTHMPLKAIRSTGSAASGSGPSCSQPSCGAAIGQNSTSRHVPLEQKILASRCRGNIPSAGTPGPGLEGGC